MAYSRKLTTHVLVLSRMLCCVGVAMAGHEGAERVVVEQVL